MSRRQLPLVDWDRYWAPVERNIEEDIGNDFLPNVDDPLSRFWGEYWLYEEYQAFPCLVLLGAPGSGKSSWITSFLRIRESGDRTPQNHLLVDLVHMTNYNDLHRLVFDSAELNSWKETDYEFELFLDSFDEAREHFPNLVQYLVDELGELSIDNLKRLRLRLLSRPFSWKATDTDSLKNLWKGVYPEGVSQKTPPKGSKTSEDFWFAEEDGDKKQTKEEAVQVLKLLPLREVDVQTALDAWNVPDQERFIERVNQTETQFLVARPAILQELVSLWTSETSAFPTQSLELYDRAVYLLCDERSDSRRSANLAGHFTSNQRKQIAGRLAADLLFSEKNVIITGPVEMDAGQNEVHLGSLVGRMRIGPDDAFSIGMNEITDVLSHSALFTPLGLDRFGFSQTIIQEFLAACDLNFSSVKMEKILGLFFRRSEGQFWEYPQNAKAAAWLAVMNSDFFQLVSNYSPAILLHADLSRLPEDTLQLLTAQLLSAIEAGMALPWDRWSRGVYHKLATPNLSVVLRSYLKLKTKKLDARREAIEIARACNVSEVQNDLLNICLDEDESIRIRQDAGYALYLLGDDARKEKIRPLLRQEKSLELQEIALLCLWPAYLDVSEVLEIVSWTPTESKEVATQESQIHFGGTSPKKIPPGYRQDHHLDRVFKPGYSSFLRGPFIEKMGQKDLEVFLSWLAHQQVDWVFSHKVEWILPSLMQLTFDNLDKERIQLLLAEVFVSAVKHHHSPSELLKESLSYSLREKNQTYLRFPDDKVRRQIINNCVLHPQLSEPYSISLLKDGVLVEDDDFDWVLGKAIGERNAGHRQNWVWLLSSLVRRDNEERIDTLRAALGKDDVPEELETEFKWILSGPSQEFSDAMRRHEEQREKWESEQQQRREKNRELYESIDPNAEVSKAIEKSSENLEGWWYGLTEFLLETFEDDEFIRDQRGVLDLTVGHNWNRLNRENQENLIELAKHVLRDLSPDNPFEYRGPSPIGFNASIAQAFVLVHNGEYDQDPLGQTIWKKWVPAILSFEPDTTSRNLYRHLLKRVWEHAPEEVGQALRSLFEQNPRLTSVSSLLKEVSEIAGMSIAPTLLEMLRGTDDDHGYKTLANTLFKVAPEIAEKEAKSVLGKTLPRKQKELQKPVELCFQYFLSSPRSCWDFVAKRLHTNTAFSKQFIWRFTWDIHFEKLPIHLLDEIHLQEFYLLIEKRFPREKDPKPISNESWSSSGADPNDIRMLQNMIISQLQNRKTKYAIQALDAIASKLLHHEWLSRTAIEARKELIQSTYKPVEASDLNRLLNDPGYTLIRSDDELFNAVLESLERVTRRLSGRFNLMKLFWNPAEAINAKPGTKNLDPWNRVVPKYENEVSDVLATLLEEDMKALRSTIQREVEVRRKRATGRGEQLDIYIGKPVAPGADAWELVVVLEVKANWGNSLYADMDKQLQQRYMKISSIKRGIYLVAWFDSKCWDERDSRKKRSKKNRAEVEKKLKQKAASLTDGERMIEPYLLDLTLDCPEVKSTRSKRKSG